MAPSAVTATTKTVVIMDDIPAFIDTSELRALQAYELTDSVHVYAAATSNTVQHADSDSVEIHAANDYKIDQFPKAVTDAVGAGKVGIRLSPVTPINDAFAPDPQSLFNYVVLGMG